MSRRPFRVLAAVSVVVLLATSCGGGASDELSVATTAPSSDGSGVATSDAPTGGDTEVVEREVTISPLAYRQISDTEAEGVSTPVTIAIEPSDDPEIRVSISDDEVDGTGDQWRSAAWNAVTVATLLTGSPLSGREFSFELSGRTDGPSAGALMTIAIISLLRGDTLADDITMTGTINPDGTVGPVGGIPYKIDGAVSAGKTRMLIPEGSRNSIDEVTGQSVDVVAAGRAKDVEVTEVADIYEAYELFTGVELPRPGEEGSVELSEESYTRIKAKVDDAVARGFSSISEGDTLLPAIRSALSSTFDEAAASLTRAQDLSDQGQQAGAYTEAVTGAGLANASVAAGRLLEVYFTSGTDAFLSQLDSSTAIDARLAPLFDTLKAFEPTTVSDVSALLDGFGGAIDALSLSNFADSLLANLSAATSEEEALTYAALGAVFKEFAGTLIDASNDVFEVGRGLGGAELASDIDLAPVSDFFRKGAEANLAAFDAVVLQSIADQNGVSLDSVKTYFAGQDLDYAFATEALGVIEGQLDEYLEDDSADYASIGGSVTLYARTAALMAKYYSLQAELDENLDVIGIGNQQALTSALDLGKSQVERAASLLLAQGVDPTLVIAAYESAGVDREGDASDKLDALSSYWGAFMTSRVLAYTGGFETEGL